MNVIHLKGWRMLYWYRGVLYTSELIKGRLEREKLMMISFQINLCVIWQTAVTSNVTVQDAQMHANWYNLERHIPYVASIDIDLNVYGLPPSLIWLAYWRLVLNIGFRTLRQIYCNLYGFGYWFYRSYLCFF